MLPEYELHRARSKLDSAYVHFAVHQPFFDFLLAKLRRVETTVLPDGSFLDTAATDGHTIYYNMEFVASLMFDEIVGLLAHEVGHVAQLHHLRREGRDPLGWNIAGDQVINWMLKTAGFKLPKGAIEGVGGKSTEELYHELPPEQKNGGGRGQGVGTWGWVIDATNPDGSPLTETEREHAINVVRVSLQQAVNAARTAGNMPAGFEQYIKDVMEPRIPWRELLARWADDRVPRDFNWSYPNRRYVHSGVMLPSLSSPGAGRLIFAGDMSGSMQAEQQREVCSELIGQLEVYEEHGQEVELDALWFDSAVYHQVITDAADLKPQGGGGTSFSVVFEYIKEHDLRAKAIVLVTDGQCQDYGTEPDFPVLWVLTQACRSFNPPFGELICTLN